MTVIDAHHHVWRIERTPWLRGPMVPRIFGDYEPLRRDYGIDEFASDARPHGVVKSVYVQVNVAPGDEVWEVGWAAQEGLRAGLVQAVVGFADLASPEVGAVLDRQLAAGPIRGVRQQVHWHEDPRYRFAAMPDAMLRPAWRDGLRAVTSRGLHFELQVFPAQYERALELVDGHPDTTFVLLHCGMLEDRSPEAEVAWAAGLGRFAERPNVLAKISGLGTFDRRCDVERWRPIVHRTIQAFGAERCLFGSNFPIERLWTDYGTLLATVRACLATCTSAERQAVLHDTAARLYRI